MRGDKSLMKKRQKGFTLVEMMVVIAVIALIAVFALPKLTNYFKLSLNSATRNIATMVRETYNSTALTGNIHRVVYDLKDHAYWVESGPPNVLLDTADSKEKDERRKRFKFKNAEPPKPKFSIETTITKTFGSPIRRRLYRAGPRAHHCGHGLYAFFSAWDY